MIDLNDRIAPAELKDEEAVEAWMTALVEAGVNFHPEETFRELFDVKTGVRTFRPEDADRLDELMDRAAAICEPAEVAIRVFEKAGI